MQRRKFIQLLGGSLAIGAGVACRRGAAGGVGEQAGGYPLDAKWFHSSRKFANTGFGNIAYVERGRGAVALFLHGFPLNGFQWRGALERLSPHRRCIAPDFMAMGHTEVAATQDVGPEAQTAMIISLLDALEVPKADLVANDSGGAVAQLLAIHHPDRVRTLLLTNCDTEVDSPPPALLPVIELSRKGKFADEWLAPWRADTALARSGEGIGGMCYANPANPTDDAIEAYFAPLLESSHRKKLIHAYAIALERNALIGAEEALRMSTIPTRIVWGTADSIFSPESAGYLDRTLGNSRGVRRLAGSKLFWPEELPDVIAEEASRLWSA